MIAPPDFPLRRPLAHMARGDSGQQKLSTFSRGMPLLAVPNLRAVAIVAAQNEVATVGSVLAELSRLPLERIVAVVNGSTDGTADVARRAGCTMVEFPFALGHDVGRAVGAANATSDVYLFVDADIPCRAEDLMPFLLAVHSGVDVALNDLSGMVSVTDTVSMAKRFLNLALGRPELGYASMTAVPHALSRRAVQRLGDHLAVPPLAQTMAVLAGLQVRAVHRVDVISTNRHHPPSNLSRRPETLQELIVGDHLEALEHLTARRGDRCGFTDGQRRREVIPQGDK